MTTTQSLKEKKKHLKIETTSARQRIMPSQNKNQNQNTVTNFSNGKISVEKMDQEFIIQEKKTTDTNLRQLAEKAIKSKPLLTWENNQLVIHPGEDGFKPDADDLDRMIHLNTEQLQSLSQEAKD